MDEESFSALGLGALEARLLAVVVAQEEVTATDLAAATGMALSAISVAVRGLVRRGLLERVAGRRPSVIFLSPEAPEALARLSEARDKEWRERCARAAEATALLEAAAKRREERGRPYHELEPPIRREDVCGGWPRSKGRTSHDQVALATDLAGWRSSQSLIGCPARLLVVGTDVDLDHLARRQQPGSEVRSTEEPHPNVWLLDGERDGQRVGLVAGTRWGTRGVWSRDAGFVRAAKELFELWWERAPTGVVTPYPKVATEEDLDVEEWDPEDMPDGLPTELSG